MKKKWQNGKSGVCSLIFPSKTHTYALHTNSSTISSAGTLHFMWCISQFTFNWIQCVHLPFDIWPFWKCHKKNCANGTAGGSFLFCIALIAIQKCIVVEHKAVCASCVHVGYVPRERILFFFHPFVYYVL